ncbi:MAG: glycosyltransferase [Chloroflexi bacterium]|nr:glycosyltransferase [Chloroflexota bacterium]
MRLGEATAAPSDPAGVRVLVDVRSLQDARGPVTAAYLRGLLGAFAADPLPGESFVLLLDLGADDPAAAFPGLPIVGKRRLPHTRIFRSFALTLDPFLVRGAALGSGRSVEPVPGGASVVAHAVGGALPIGPGLPVVATLLDLAPWELPETYQRTPAARFGQRLRAQLLRDADAVIVGSAEVARSATRLLRIRPSRLRIVPFAGGDAFAPFSMEGTEVGDAQRASLATDRERFGVPDRYFVYTGRHDARHDLGTLLDGLALLAAAGRPARLAKSVAWPPRILLVDTTPADRAAVALAAASTGVGELIHYAPSLPPPQLAGLVAGARAVVHPAVSDAAGLAVLDALAAGTPVVASAVGALPEIVGPAGLLVEPRDPDRLAQALGAAWSDDRVHRGIAQAAAARTGAERRRWADVARDTRAVYAAVAGRDAPALPQD